MKLAILNFSDGIYKKGQERLRKSLLDHGLREEQLLFWDAYPDHWPKNSEVTMGFKTYAFQEAKNNGFTAGLWIDANCVCVQSLDPIIKKMEHEGMYLFSRFSDSVGNWISDYSLHHLDVTREYVHHMPELAACTIGINLNHSTGQEFFKQWSKAAIEKEAFNGTKSDTPFMDTRDNDNFSLSKDLRVKGHRADQSVAGVIAGKLQITPDNKYVYDIIGESKASQNYSTYIPYGTILIQNRDIKKGKYILNDYSQYTQSKSLLYKYGRLLYSTKRTIKDFLKWNILYKKKYPYIEKSNGLSASK
jgi:hypothetical protein